jgi:hypothetical protein
LSPRQKKSEKSGSEAGEHQKNRCMFVTSLSYLIRGVTVLRPFSLCVKCGSDYSLFFVDRGGEK